MRGLFNIRGLALGACLLLGAYGSTAQSNKLATAIKIEEQTKTPVQLPLFEISSANDVHIDQEIKKVTYLKLNKETLQALRQQGHSLISFQLPVDGTLRNFTLYNYNILDGGFKLYERGADGAKRQIAYNNAGSFFRGAITGKESSLAAFSFYDDEVAAVFSTLDGGNYNLVLNYENPGAANDNYILFREADVLTARTAKCGVTDDMYKVEQEDENLGAKNMYNSCNKLRVSMHADYRLYVRRNNSITAVTNYLTSLFNAISILFNNEGINAVMSEVVINSAPDGYTYGGSDEVLEKFGEEMQTTTLDGDIAQMVSGYRQGGWAPLGGLAWLDVLCNAPNDFPNGNGGTTWSGPYSMSNNEILNNIPQIPMYSWDVNASIHEMGHNIGSPHTQSCTWPGGAIDDCYPTENGNCAPGPTPVDGGTIMSYCHLSGVGINFALGFGPLPGQRIRNRMASKSCLTSFVPDKTLTVASTTRIANKECTAGSWTSYYFDNNTADESDDELLLMIKTNSQNIGNVDTAGFEVKMITTQQYSTGVANTTAVPYAQGDWNEINRSWMVTLPGAQPANNVSIRFPFTNQDLQDVVGSVPLLTQPSQFSAVSFKNQTAANNPGTASSADVSIYTNGSIANASNWVLGTTGNYSYAEIVSNYGIFGGTLGLDAASTSIGKVKQRDILNIYPNPASNELFIQIPAGWKAGQQSLEIFDNLGRLVMKENVVNASNGNHKIAVGNLAQGVYTIRYVQGDKTFNAMFVKK